MDLHERQRAETIRAQYTAAEKTLRADADLSDDGRSRRLAEAWVKARKELDGLRESETARLASRERELERRLFGLPSSDGAEAISIRDAQDRASRITRSDEAAALLERAERNGDQALARAVAHHAIQQSRTAPTREAVGQWDNVAGAFLDARPQYADVVEELAQIERLGAREVFSPFSLPQPNGVLPVDINRARGSDAETHASPQALQMQA